MKSCIVIILLGLILIPICSNAGPFGTRMGQHKEEFEALKKMHSDEPSIESYYTSKLPKRHSLFDSYVLNFGNNGLFSVAGLSKEFEDDRAAQQAIHAYNNIKKQLTEKYGLPIESEYLIPDAFWNKNNEFAMSLVKHEREHFCEWKNNLPDDLKLIRLMIIGKSIDKVTVGLLYEYKNIDENKKIQDSIEKDSL